MSDVIVRVRRPVVRVVVGSVPSLEGGAPLGADLTAIEDLTGTGIACRTDDDTWTLRSVAAGNAGLSVAHPGGVGGNITVSLEAGLLSLASVDTGADLLPYTTAADTWSSTGITAFARTLLDDVSAPAARDTLGVVEQYVFNATPASSTTDNVNGVSTGLVLELDTGTWLVEGTWTSTSAVTTTGIQYQWQGGGGIAVVECEFSFVTYNGATAQQQAATTGLASWSGNTNGPGATARPTFVNGLVRVTTAGTLTLWMRSEIAGSAVTLVRGGVRVTRLE